MYKSQNPSNKYVANTTQIRLQMAEDGIVTFGDIVYDVQAKKDFILGENGQYEEYIDSNGGGGGGTPTLQDKQVQYTSNGTNTVTADSGYDGLSSVEVDVEVQPNLQQRSLDYTENGSFVIEPEQGYDGLSRVVANIDVENGDILVEITYDELRQLYDDGELVPGTFYRITDYVTKVNGTYDLTDVVGQEAYIHYARSAEHPFDIIVQALSEDYLSENAQAIQHDGDTYFVHSDLASWQLKYTIENNPIKYSWADTNGNGKGVIYWMKDEFNNECPYDFKNVQFLLYGLESARNEKDDQLLYANSGLRYGSPYYLAMIAMGNNFPDIWDKKFSFDNIVEVLSHSEVDQSYLSNYNADWYYTFDYDGEDTGASHYDASINWFNGITTFDNIIKPVREPFELLMYSQTEAFGLPNIVFRGNSIFDNIFEDECCYNIFGYGIYNSRFEHNFIGNIIGPLCYNNIFGFNLSGIAFDESCQGNTVDDFTSNVYFYENSIDNIVGKNCSYLDIESIGTHIGNNCSGIDIHGYSNYHTIGYDCHDIYIGDESHHNIIGDYCSGISLNFAINNCIIGSHSYNIVLETLYDDSSDINPSDCGIYRAIIEENARHITLNYQPSQTADYAEMYRVQGCYYDDAIVNLETRSYDSPIKYIGLDSSDNIVQWIPADESITEIFTTATIMPTAELVSHGETMFGFTVRLSVGIPTVGIAATTDGVYLTLYYDMLTGNVKGYVDETLASQYSIPAGWYDAADLFAIADVSYGGVIYDMADSSSEDDTVYVLTNLRPSPNNRYTEGALYRYAFGSLYYGDTEMDSPSRVIVVNGLPDEGEPVTTDFEHVTAYYDLQNSGAFAYVDATVAEQMSVPVGWYPLAVLAAGMGLTYAGVVYAPNEIVNDDAHRMLIMYSTYYYKDGKFWGNDALADLMWCARKINELDDTTEYLWEDLYYATQDISTLQGDVSTINSDITTINGDITTMNNAITSIQNQIGILNSELEALL